MIACASASEATWCTFTHSSRNSFRIGPRARELDEAALRERNQMPLRNSLPMPESSPQSKADDWTIVMNACRMPCWLCRSRLPLDPTRVPEVASRRRPECGEINFQIAGRRDAPSAFRGTRCLSNVPGRVAP